MDFFFCAGKSCFYRVNQDGKVTEKRKTAGDISGSEKGLEEIILQNCVVLHILIFLLVLPDLLFPLLL